MGLPESLLALEPELTSVHAELGMRPEYNRVFSNCIDFSASGGMVLNRVLSVDGGVALGTMGSAFNLSLFTRVRYDFSLPRNIPLALTFNYIYNNIPSYHNSLHSFMPLLSTEWRRAGLTLGGNCRITRFNSGEDIFEPILVFSVYVNLLNRERVKVGLKYANYSDFLSGNMGSYSLDFYTHIQLSSYVLFKNEVELLQTGSVGLASNFYGVAYRGGILFQW